MKIGLSLKKYCKRHGTLIFYDPLQTTRDNTMIEILKNQTKLVLVDLVLIQIIEIHHH